MTSARLAGLLLFAAACAQPPRGEPLRAGVATVPLDAPVGLSLGGYSARARHDGSVRSPWADRFAPSRGVHTQPTARALMLDDALTQVTLIRVDLCLVTQTLRFRAQQRARELGVTSPLLIVATHTHSGPARYFPPVKVLGASGFDVAASGMDTYEPFVEERLAASIAQAAAAARDTLRPVRVGVASVDAAELNGDRRCENDPLYGAGRRDRELTVLRLDEVAPDGSTVPYAGVLHYALHGTVLDEDEVLMSTDAPGALELYGSDAVGVPMLFVQGAAGDVSPALGPHGHVGFQAIERLGRVGARKVRSAYDLAAPTGEAPRLSFRELAVPLGGKAMGYATGEFPASGAIGCIFGDVACGVPTPKEQIVCLPLDALPARYTSVGVLGLGPATFVGLPGEPSTGLGERVRALWGDGAGPVLIAGYAQDHHGYLLEEEDFLRGGYEARVTPWGWRWGAHLVEHVARVRDPQSTASGAEPPALVEPGPAPAVEASLAAAAITREPSGLERLGVAAIELLGADPQLGTPRVRVERRVGGAFEPVMASPTRVVEGGPEVLLRYVHEGPGLHRWSAEWETLADTPLGEYRFAITGRQSARGAVETFTLASAPFVVGRSRAAGAVARAVLRGGKLEVRLRFPPNPPRYEQGRQVAHYRLRDADAPSTTGLLAHGGHAVMSLVGPSSARAIELRWDEGAQALVADAAGLALPLAIELAPGGFEDGAGNTNGAALRVQVEADP